MATGFTKLVPEIIHSSIWNESSDVRVVWITMLAVKDENGYVRGDAKTIARIANVPLEAAANALERFQEPDPSSHTPDNEGRRIAPAPGGWVILNHDLYRSGDRNAYMREYMRKRREKPTVNTVNVNTSLPSASASVSASASEGIGGLGEREIVPSIPDEVHLIANEGAMRWCRLVIGLKGWTFQDTYDFLAGKAMAGVDLGPVIAAMDSRPDRTKSIKEWWARSGFDPPLGHKTKPTAEDLQAKVRAGLEKAEAERRTRSPPRRQQHNEEPQPMEF